MAQGICGWGGARTNLVWDVTAKSIGHILKATDALTDLEGRFLSNGRSSLSEFQRFAVGLHHFTPWVAVIF